MMEKKKKMKRMIAKKRKKKVENGELPLPTEGNQAYHRLRQCYLQPMDASLRADV